MLNMQENWRLCHSIILDIWSKNSGSQNDTTTSLNTNSNKKGSGSNLDHQENITHVYDDLTFNEQDNFNAVIFLEDQSISPQVFLTPVVQYPSAITSWYMYIGTMQHLTSKMDQLHIASDYIGHALVMLGNVTSILITYTYHSSWVYFLNY